jgi:hypothetical protein
MPAPVLPASAPPARRPAAAALALFVAFWVLLLAVPPVVLVRNRSDWLQAMENGTAQADWEDFRSDMRRQSGREGPVQRKVPKSAEPPLKVWLRDHLALAITAWVVLGGTLGGFLGMMVAGAAGYSPSSARAVAATTRNSTSAMPSTPSSENTATFPREERSPAES